MNDYIKVDGDFMNVSIKVIAGSSKSMMVDVENGYLKIKISAVAEDGKANAALKAFLAKSIGCAKKDISIKSGEKSRLKVISLPLAYKDSFPKV
ncbi:MAG: hypothetical protein Ta2F_08840 [Termitinemataceae bacterium]|nr:MAG: hypothetical protein Ta2F_08840 [Termitinemataceae bacterium]